MRDVRKVREQSQLRLTYAQFFALLGLMGVSLLLSGLLGYYFGRGATAAEQASVSILEGPLIPVDVETESVATLLALARERRREGDERLSLDYSELLPQSDTGVPQVLRKAPAPETISAVPPVPREVEPAALVSTDDSSVEAPAVDPPSAKGSESIPDTAAVETPKFTIQVGSFQEAGQGDVLVAELQRKGFEAFLVSAEVNGRIWYRVRVGAFTGKDEATAEMERLKLIRTDLRPMVTFQ